MSPKQRAQTLHRIKRDLRHAHRLTQNRRIELDTLRAETVTGLILCTHAERQLGAALVNLKDALDALQIVS